MNRVLWTFKVKADFLPISFVALFILLFQTGCTPVFSELQSAKLIEKGEFEVTAARSSVSWDGDHVQDHYGLQVAAGLSEKSNLRLRYEHVETDDFGLSNSSGLTAEVISLGLKREIDKDRIALYLPIGFAFGGDIEESETWAFHPTLLFSHSVNRYIELNPSVKALIPLSNSNAEILVAVNLGIGISPNIDKWVIRPETGWLFDPGEEGHYTHFSIGLTIYP
jgi:ABC-type Fe3+-hydroxamate transport system substrate-binding protein